MSHFCIIKPHMQILFESDQRVDFVVVVVGSEDAKRVGERREGLCFNRLIGTLVCRSPFLAFNQPGGDVC